MLVSLMLRGIQNTFQIVFVLGLYQFLPCGISFGIAYLLARGFLSQTQLNILMFGVAILIEGWVFASLTIMDFLVSVLGPFFALEAIGFLVSSMLVFVGALLSFQRLCTTNLKLELSVAYLLVTAVIAALTYASVNDFSSAFWAFGIGMTSLYKGIVVLQVILLLTSSILLFIKARKNGKSVLYWYSLGQIILAFITVSSLWEPLNSVITMGYSDGFIMIAGYLLLFIFALAYLKESLLVQREVIAI